MNEALTIDRITLLDQLYDLENEYCKKYSEKPINVSSWNNDGVLAKILSNSFVLNETHSLTQYIYSYDFDDSFTDKIKNKFGISQNNGILITSNNTISIVCIANFLQKRHIKNIAVITPAYFSVEHCFDAFSLNYCEISMQYSNSTYTLPRKEIKKIQPDALFVTNPVFSSGHYLSNEDLYWLNTLAQNGTIVIFDESFCSWKKESFRIITSNNALFIHSPHKSISFNSYKFSLISFRKELQDFFDHWCDIFAGGLSQANYNAILHFCDMNYDLINAQFDEYTIKSADRVKELIKHYDNLSIDQYQSGEYLMIRDKYHNSSLFGFQELKKMIYAIHAYFLPGYLHGYNNELCFRVNLAALDDQHFNALIRICDYISSL